MFKYHFKIRLIIVLSLVMLNKSICCAESMVTNNLTLLVTSCDRYSSLWPGFFKQLFLHIPELRNNTLPIILIGNKKSFPDNRVTTVLTGNDISWSDNMLKVLEKVKTDYIFLLLDDYYLTSFDVARFNQIYNYMMSHPEVSYIQLSKPNQNDLKNDKVHEIPDLYYKKQKAQYRTALQACLWKTKELELLIKTGESAWDFEIPGSERSQLLSGKFLTTGNNFSLDYINIVYGGYVYDYIVLAAKDHGIVLDNDFPLQSDHRFYLWFRRTFLVYLRWEIYMPVKDYIISTCKKLIT